jgi:hypothetical protein
MCGDGHHTTRPAEDGGACAAERPPRFDADEHVHERHASRNERRRDGELIDVQRHDRARPRADGGAQVGIGGVTARRERPDPQAAVGELVQSRRVLAGKHRQSVAACPGRREQQELPAHVAVPTAARESTP